MSLRANSAQTVGPFFSIGLSWLYKSALFESDPEQTQIAVEGRLCDGDGLAIGDALLELWQADAEGRYAQADARGALRGFGRVATDEHGMFRFSTIKPGRVPGADDSSQAPHLNVLVLMRGLLKPVRTRMYFPDQPENGDDPVLRLVPEDRRSTLIARRTGAALLRWDLHMQGQEETVFFEF
jgi:protocatechuate 3,4-dioxygenase alpha subunit